MNIVGLIPVRMESSRLPNKAILEIAEVPMILHVARRAKLSQSLDKVIVCTDSYKVCDICTENKIDVVLTKSTHTNGTERIAEAANILSTSGIQAEFWHIGGDDDGSLLSITQEEKVSYASSVDFKGHVDDMPSILNKVDIAVLPSYHEGLSRFLLESASSGLPIVSTEVGGCKYITKDGVNGFLVPPQDSHALAACIKILVEDSNLRNQMGLESRQIAVEEFEESFITNQYLTVLNKLINQ